MDNIISLVVLYTLFSFKKYISVQFSSVAQSCPTLCDPMNCSTPGLPVHHQLPEFTETHVHWVGDAIRHLILSRPLLLLPQSLPASESFPMSQLFAWGGQSTGVSALASVLPMNTQNWSPSEWTGWIYLQSKGLSRVFSNTTVQKHHDRATKRAHTHTQSSSSATSRCLWMQILLSWHLCCITG